MAPKSRAKMIETIKALIAKANATPFEPEREAFMAKAMDMLVRHKIEMGEVDAKKEAMGVTRHSFRGEKYGSKYWKRVLFGSCGRFFRLGCFIDGTWTGVYVGEDLDRELAYDLYLSIRNRLMEEADQAWGTYSRGRGRMGKALNWKNSFLEAAAVRINARVREMLKAQAATGVKASEDGRALAPGEVKALLIVNDAAINAYSKEALHVDLTKLSAYRRDWTPEHSMAAQMLGDRAGQRVEISRKSLNGGHS